MADIVDDTETFTIDLTSENGEPEPSKAPWALAGAGLIALYLMTRKRE